MRSKALVPKTTPLVSHSSRSQLPQQYHSTIDAVLKDLRICTRQLQSAVISQKTELQILDRLFYKGNNQHRTALFWSHVAETRRYGKRFEKLGIYDVVEALRVSFWGPKASLIPKSVKGAWTYTPDVRAVKFGLHRLRTCQSLTDKMHQCLTNTYHHLNLNMQTGAFLQLILTLSAIISRLDTLLSDLCLATDAALEAITKILSILDPDTTLTATTTFSHVSSNSEPSQTYRSPPGPLVEALEREATEDLARPMLTTSSTGTSKDVLRTQSPTSQQREGEDEERIDATILYAPSGTITFRSPATVASSRPSGRREGLPEVNNSVSYTEPTPMLFRKTSGSARIRNGEKKKKRDEIDDIFGF